MFWLVSGTFKNKRRLPTAVLVGTARKHHDNDHDQRPRLLNPSKAIAVAICPTIVYFIT